jgi:hypothetical protein
MKQAALSPYPSRSYPSRSNPSRRPSCVRVRPPLISSMSSTTAPPAATPHTATRRPPLCCAFLHPRRFSLRPHSFTRAASASALIPSPAPHQPPPSFRLPPIRSVGFVSSRAPSAFHFAPLPRWRSSESPAPGQLFRVADQILCFIGEHVPSRWSNHEEAAEQHVR